MDSRPFQSKTIYDYLSTIQAGMNSGISPLLLDKNQAAYISNGTVRGGFVSDRPPFTKKLTLVWPSDEVQNAVEQGLLQGTGYYQPDFGNQSLAASISGRLFLFTVNGDIVTVTEITIPGDPNPATTTQVWMWQAENYLIVNDGASLPIFYDGTSSRRSFGPAVSYGSLGAPFTPPAIGSVATATLNAPYTGPYNVPILFDGEYYQAIQNGGTTPTYNVTLTNITAAPGGLVNFGTVVYVQPGIIGYLMNAVNVSPISCRSAGTENFIITLSVAYTGAVGAQIILNGSANTVWRVVTKINPTQLSIENVTTICPPGVTNPAGTAVQYAASSAPNVPLGTVQDSPNFTIPPVGGTVAITLSSPYSGPSGAIVLIDGQQYSIAATAPTPPSGNTVNLLNLTDTGAGPVAINSELLSVPELPAGRMGAYVVTQNFVALPDGYGFVISDASRGASGTQANNFRDAVLKVVDNTFKGGNFAIPSAGNPITSITATVQLDASLGQGPCQIGTAASMFSCIAPFDFTNPPPSGSPILTESLIGTGPLAQDSTIAVNSDTLFRSRAGLGSLIIGRREVNASWGNTPISQEMRRVLDFDNETLLPYGSSIVFDNRFLTTCTPSASSQGVIHSGLVAINLDPVSSLRGKAPSVYDGLWTGINVLKLNTGVFSSKQRAFAFTFNVALSKIELFELLPQGDKHFDDGTTPITWSFETAAIFNGNVKAGDGMVSLRDGEFGVEDVFGPVRFEVFYKPDQYPCWVPWHTFSICNKEQSQQAAYFPRLGLGEPSADPCNSANNQPLRDGYTYQIRWVITGHCRFLRARFAAVTMPIPKFEEPICNADCPAAT